MWNNLVNIIRCDNVNTEDKNKARMLLSCLNTASGRTLLKKEIQYFLEEIEDKYGEIPKLS
jgi:hypothetical protein